MSEFKLNRGLGSSDREIRQINCGLKIQTPFHKPKDSFGCVVQDRSAARAA
jgi:hypothetical protein